MGDVAVEVSMVLPLCFCIATRVLLPTELLVATELGLCVHCKAEGNIAERKRQEQETGEQIVSPLSSYNTHSLDEVAVANEHTAQERARHDAQREQLLLREGGIKELP